MKAVCYIGMFSACYSGTAFVALWNRKIGERLEAQCNPMMLDEMKISVGDEFMCRVTLRGKVAFRKLKPKRITAERLAEIEREVDGILI